MDEDSRKLNIARVPVTSKSRSSKRRGSGLRRNVAITIAPKEVQGLRLQAGALRNLPHYDENPSAYEDICAEVLAQGAPALVEKLHKLRQLSHPPLLIVRGLQLDDTPVITPINGIFDQKQVPLETAMLAGIIRQLGIRGVAYAHENGGRIIRSVCPVPEQADKATSQGANVDLQSHSDNAHLCIPHSNDTHPYRLPAANAFQSFATIKPVDAVPMRVRLLGDILDHLDPEGGDAQRLEQFADLQRPEFRFSSPPSHGGAHRLEPLPAIVTLDDPALGYGLRYHASTMIGVTPRAEAALALLRFAIARTPEQVIATRRGDVILYDNRRAIHRREPYQAKFDGSDRYYIRVYGQLSADVERWEAALGGNGRVA